MTAVLKRRRPVFLLLCAASVFFTLSCRAPAPAPPAAEYAGATAGEPETYSAIIVRTVEDGQQNEVTQTLVMRAGDKRREEWLEGGQRRALIARYDTGKSFLLSLDKQLYVESELAAKVAEPFTSPGRNAGGAPDSGESENPGAAQTPALDFIEENFSEEPATIETRVLPDEIVAGELCKVVQRRFGFAGGRIETVKIFRAERLAGLMLKTEMESLEADSRVKITTEWRDIKLEVPADAFAVPANFKKVQSLPPP